MLSSNCVTGQQPGSVVGSELGPDDGAAVGVDRVGALDGTAVGVDEVGAVVGAAVGRGECSQHEQEHKLATSGSNLQKPCTTKL